MLVSWAIITIMIINFSNEDNFMKRFKQFVMSLKDDCNEHEAVDSYRRYKTKYKKNSITKFYKAHQNEEWYVKRYLALINIALVALV